jgi:hypothetical protein
MEKKIKQLAPCPADTVVLDLLSSIAYRGTNEDGLQLPTIGAGDCSYHFISSLTTAPPSTIKKTWDWCSPLAKNLLMQG